MVKVLTGAQPGQATEAEAQVIAGAPTADLKERVPQPKGLDSLLEEASVEDVAAGVEAGAEQEIAVQQQREREAVPDIITRRDTADQRVDEWGYKPTLTDTDLKKSALDASTSSDPDGGLGARSRHMADAFTTGGLHLAGLTSEHGGAAKQVVQATGALTPEGTLDRGFLQMMSVITENQLAGDRFGIAPEGVEPEADVDYGKQTPFTKAQGNKQLGESIHRDYQRYKNAQAGRPTDEYVDLTPEQATLLGDMAKEMYFQANNTFDGEQIMTRALTPDGQIAFTWTKHGATLLAKGEADRKRMFPKNNVRPAKTPLPKGQLVGEGRRITRSVSGRTGKVEGAKTINDAMRNLNQVANVVDPQRLKVLLATALPVLQGAVDPNHPFAVINHVGQSKIDEIVAANADRTQPLDVAQEYSKLVNQLAQDIHAIATERKGANHLTYYMQAFNGRIAPQQSVFNPTNSKTVRFVTRNAIPSSTAVPRVERNLRQMYAMMLVPGADSKLPEGREQALERYTPQLVRWGKELRSALEGISDAQVEAAATAIANGVALTDPSFPQIPDVTQNISPELAEAIAKKGEDGQAFIDGVLDFTDYYQKKLQGRPHHSYFNAYMDGKTNGLAGNGIQMGSEQVAYKTGVLRSQKETLLDNDIDIRDDLANVLVKQIDDNGFGGHLPAEISGPLHKVATSLFNGQDRGKISRNLHKATTMTFGYGKELDSFKQDIDEAMALMEQSDPAFAEQVTFLSSDNGMKSRDELVAALHGQYVGALATALDPNAIKSRALMRSAAYMFALSNELFAIKSATGFELHMGGTEVTGETGRTKYGIAKDAGPADESGFVPRETVIAPEAKEYGREVTSSAIKTRPDPEGGTEGVGEVGGYGYGGSVPAPVQSLDAATVALTASGKSWNRLKANSQGAPYLHTIYDAFKVDAMGYDVVLDEVNRNWLNAGMNWSYLEETQKAIAELRKTFAEKYGNRPNSDPLSEGEARQMLWFLETQESKNGKKYPGNLYNKMSKLIHIPDDLNAEGVADLSKNKSTAIVNAMKAAGYDIYNPPAQPTVGHLKAFMKAFSAELDLGNRLGKMISETNNKKKKLAAKIKQDGTKVYQYYAH